MNRLGIYSRLSRSVVFSSRPTNPNIDELFGLLTKPMPTSIPLSIISSKSDWLAKIGENGREKKLLPLCGDCGFLGLFWRIVNFEFWAMMSELVADVVLWLSGLSFFKRVLWLVLVLWFDVISWGCFLLTGWLLLLETFGIPVFFGLLAVVVGIRSVNILLLLLLFVATEDGFVLIKGK